MEANRLLQIFLMDYRDLMAWMTDLATRISSGEPARNVREAEALLELHTERKVQKRLLLLLLVMLRPFAIFYAYNAFVKFFFAPLGSRFPTQDPQYKRMAVPSFVTKSLIQYLIKGVIQSEKGVNGVESVFQDCNKAKHLGSVIKRQFRRCLANTD